MIGRQSEFQSDAGGAIEWSRFGPDMFFFCFFFFVDVLNFCVTQSDEKAESLLSFVPFVFQLKEGEHLLTLSE